MAERVMPKTQKARMFDYFKAFYMAEEKFGEADVSMNVKIAYNDR